MKNGWHAVVLLGALAAALIGSISCSSCKRASHSASRESHNCCAAYQHTDPLPDQPSPGVIRLAIGGDSRDDHSHVIPWAFKEARRRGAKAFLFLGDLELSSSLDRFFAPQLADLGDVLFYPVIGNHEVEFLGFVRLPGGRHKVTEFKEDFLKAPGIHVAPIQDQVVYSADLQDTIHFIALDNVSRKGEGFGTEQLDWLAKDLAAASAAKKIILVGMHKGLAGNPVTTHAMDEDGKSAEQDSDAALALFKQYQVAMVFVSHSHRYASYRQDGIEVRMTGGLGAPLVKGLGEADGGFHHFLVADVPPRSNRTPLKVEVVRFPGAPTKDDQDELKEAAEMSPQSNKHRFKARRPLAWGVLGLAAGGSIRLLTHPVVFRSNYPLQPAAARKVSGPRSISWLFPPGNWNAVICRLTPGWPGAWQPSARQTAGLCAVP